MFSNGFKVVIFLENFMIKIFEVASEFAKVGCLESPIGAKVAGYCGGVEVVWGAVAMK
jgi:hypothetical protein